MVKIFTISMFCVILITFMVPSVLPEGEDMKQMLSRIREGSTSPSIELIVIDKLIRKTKKGKLLWKRVCPVVRRLEGDEIYYSAEYDGYHYLVGYVLEPEGDILGSYSLDVRHNDLGVASFSHPWSELVWLFCTAEAACGEQLRERQDGESRPSSVKEVELLLAAARSL